MSKTIQNVKSVTKKSPALKTNARKLAVRVWMKELKELGVNPSIFSVSDFLNMYTDGTLSSATTIARASRNLD
jgi:hypothetical protein